MAWYLAAANLAAFCLLGVDKGRARRQVWRISERVLFLFPLLGGALGGVLGMVVFNHKTKHNIFRFGFPALLMIQLGVVIYLLWRFLLS